MVAQVDWLGHPSQADALPASVESVPGQWAGAFSGTVSGRASATCVGAADSAGGTAGKEARADVEGCDCTAIMM